MERVKAMNKINVLDCTLRDGGYCNQWQFGFDNIQKIVSGLVEANIDIIECGFLSNRVDYDKDNSRFATIQDLSTSIPDDRAGKIYVCMMNYGEYNVADLPEWDGSSVDGIRIAFSKKDLDSSLELCKAIKRKGYKVFVQAMVSLNYSDEEFLSLIRRCNEFEPYAFYIVDSFGVMKRKDLIRLFYLVEHNLKEQIAIGYHSHNNMQLAYSNAQALVDIHTNHNMILDSSIFGMGRGAGNLNTELFVEYLNDNIGTSYALKPLLTVIDEVLNTFYQQNYWGYSLPNYLSAKHNAHPNYAGYLDGKKTLTAENIDEIFSMMDETKRAGFDKQYIENLYIKYMATGKVIETHLAEFKKRIAGKKVMIIAPGKSSKEEKEKIISVAGNEDIITISINFNYEYCDANYIFLSNLRRFRDLSNNEWDKSIVTSNIPTVDAFLQTEYKDLLNDTEAVRDNAAMMLIKLLINMDASTVLIAGLDGYSLDSSQNFADPKMNFYANKAEFESMNTGMVKVLREYKAMINIEFVTTPRYVNL
jgi:4-hydroxy 2-oxovalerate aldolase